MVCCVRYDRAGIILKFQFTPFNYWNGLVIDNTSRQWSFEWLGWCWLLIGCCCWDLGNNICWQEGWIKDCVEMTRSKTCDFFIPGGWLQLMMTCSLHHNMMKRLTWAIASLDASSLSLKYFASSYSNIFTWTHVKYYFAGSCYSATQSSRISLQQFILCSSILL